MGPAVFSRYSSVPLTAVRHRACHSVDMRDLWASDGRPVPAFVSEAADGRWPTNRLRRLQFAALAGLRDPFAPRSTHAPPAIRSAAFRSLRLHRSSSTSNDGFGSFKGPLWTRRPLAASSPLLPGRIDLHPYQMEPALAHSGMGSRES